MVNSTVVARVRPCGRAGRSAAFPRPRRKTRRHRRACASDTRLVLCPGEPPIRSLGKLSSVSYEPWFKLKSGPSHPAIHLKCFIPTAPAVSSKRETCPQSLYRKHPTSNLHIDIVAEPASRRSSLTPQRLPKWKRIHAALGTISTNIASKPRRFQCSFRWLSAKIRVHVANRNRRSYFPSITMVKEPGMGGANPPRPPPGGGAGAVPRSWLMVRT